MLNFLLIIFSLFILHGCLPAIFTAVTSSSYEMAKDRTLGETIDDAKIATAIKGGFIKDNFRVLYTKINVEVLNGRVLYTGRVDKEEDMMTAVQIAWNQRGVKEVINELKVDEKSSYFDLGQYTRDTLITSQIKSKLLINRDIKFVNYTIITINNIVYIFGIARSEEELQKVTNIASTIKGVEKVIVHVRSETENNMHTEDENEHNYQKTLN